jgi:protein-L-isoaspartate(D-aspartate) O-methyltransferase
MATDLDFDEARQRMVRAQIAARGLHDPRVLAAMRTVPRHLFVPPAERALAYEDRPLPIGEGQTISQPFMVAAMTAALSPPADGRVLEVGTGSGYQAAVLAQLAREVISIERHAPLATRAEAALADAGVANVRVVVGDGSQGLPDEAPFDGILVTAGAPSVPEALREQLADGARLVIPVGPPTHQVLTIITRRGTSFDQQSSEACVFVPLIGRFGWHQ